MPIDDKQTDDKEKQLKTHDKEGMPMEYYQKLLNVLFMLDDNLSIGLRIRFWLFKAYPNLFIKFKHLFPFAEFNADFKGGNFKELVLPNAYFANGNFEGAKVMNANLSEANLKGANLKGANLSGANLSGANLSRTKHWNKKP